VKVRTVGSDSDWMSTEVYLPLYTQATRPKKIDNEDEQPSRILGFDIISRLLVQINGPEHTLTVESPHKRTVATPPRGLPTKDIHV